jgi:signal peptidase I
MARLLRDNDYLRVIQSDNLAQIIESNQQTKLDVEQSAQSEMISYLAQRYLINSIFTDTKVFDITATYNGKQLVEWTASAFSAATVYTANQYVLQGGYIYKSIAGSAAHAFNASEWTQICLDKTLFYVTLPEDEYVNTTSYVVGDVVYYNNIEYTCLLNCKGILPTETGFWSVGSAYTLTATYPDDDIKWTEGDNRNQQIVMYLLDITLYHLHSRINPRNVPDLRKERYDGNNATQNGGAIAWLKRVASGDLTADLPSILPQQGVSIRWGNSDGTTIKSSNQLW